MAVLCQAEATATPKGVHRRGSKTVPKRHKLKAGTGTVVACRPNDAGTIPGTYRINAGWTWHRLTATCPDAYHNGSALSGIRGRLSLLRPIFDVLGSRPSE